MEVIELGDCGVVDNSFLEFQERVTREIAEVFGGRVKRHIQPPDSGLGEPKRRYEETFSAVEVIMEMFNLKPARLAAASDTDAERSQPGSARQRAFNPSA
jgi:hypothetical protein